MVFALKTLFDTKIFSTSKILSRKHIQLNEDACAGMILENMNFIAMARHHKIVSEALISV